MKPTLTLLADWCTLLMNGYPAAVAEYRRDPSALNQQVLDSAVIVLQNVAKAVPVLLPEVWPDLRLVFRGALWHADPQFDWDAAETELRLIEAAARQAEKTTPPILNTPPKPTEPNVDALLDAADLKISEIASDTARGGEERMLEILRIDSRYQAKPSTWWSELLGVRDATIRGYDTWKSIQNGKRNPEL